ncbi:hypothetical protein A374_02714 [Fictibacillus macauensis ZFHKF-1]|uniref:M20/M25/M40 family metallo-hydrolase n=1 Tax=Fictibacillus macauensis ZFHKF-1 TaxID=1196324 RepID=I8UJS7_9BACL|nr:M20/M25/M40 family metallo-hydrolase [Fictibacillus macauensis]EIT87130.1 hypothetical protein A374_02714 [Fictibacillus macauensis ZFHKF-1]
MERWQHKEGLTGLLKQLVQIPSITNYSAEITLAEFLYDNVQDLPYFQQHKEHASLHDTGDGRKIFTALVQQDPSKETIVLLSHFDVVGVDDFGELQHLAFSPDELTHHFYNSEAIPSPIKEELNEEWLFGRGIMDMKAGVALHLSMIEKACSGNFPGNILMLSVPDEEVNSKGMIAAVGVLNMLQERHQLRYKACLNGEPAFTRYPGDPHHYMYTGSVGKVLPGFLCYGQETHVGEPFLGLNGNLMASMLTTAMELNVSFCEQFDDEVIPPPTNLLQKDLKDHYSVQIPHAAATLFNLLLLERPLHEVTQQLLQIAEQTASDLEQLYRQRARAYQALQPCSIPDFTISVYTVHELYEHALTLYSKEFLAQRQEQLQQRYHSSDDRELTIQIVYDLASLCKQQAPMIVLFYAPPFYPAICSSHDQLITKTTAAVRDYAKNQLALSLQTQHYFAGLSDLSYVGLQYELEELTPLLTNMPLFTTRYQLPLEEMKQLTMPVMNVGPLGRDAHKWTERLNVSSFMKTHALIAYTIETLLKG